MIFRWLIDRVRKGPPAWVVHTPRGAIGTKDEPCLKCSVPKQAHKREFHPFEGRKK